MLIDERDPAIHVSSRLLLIAEAVPFFSQSSIYAAFYVQFKRKNMKNNSQTLINLQN